MRMITITNEEGRERMIRRARQWTWGEGEGRGAARMDLRSDERFFSDRFNRNRVSVYALGHRAAMMSPLEALNAPPIVLHEAQKAKLLLPYEDIFRVLCKYFNDCVLTEYQFDQKFFVKIEMFKAIFGGAIHLFLVRPSSFLPPSLLPPSFLPLLPLSLRFR